MISHCMPSSHAQDPVYGQTVLSGGALLDIMDSQPFQRLRELCQLGTTKCVRRSRPDPEPVAARQYKPPGHIDC